MILDHDADRSGSVTLHATCGVTKAASVRAKVERVLAGAGVEWTLLAQPGVAVLDYALASNVRANLRELLAAARKAAESEGGALSVRDAPREALIAFDPFGEPAAGLDLMRAVQRRLDPSGVFRSGRFHGEL